MAGINSKKLQIGGMTCIGCQNRIEKRLRKTSGVKTANVSYVDGTLDISYDEDVLTFKDISAVVQTLGYRVLADRTPKADARRVAGILIILFAVYMLLRQFGLTDVFKLFPAAETSMGYGMLFVIGLLTSFHCVAMCGGINLSQCIPQNRGGNGGRAAVLRSSFLYNIGRVASYTAAGFLVGALGSAVTFSSGAQGALKLIAGAFMIIMGVNMLGIFPQLRRFVPRMPQGLFRESSDRATGGRGPLVVGLLNGLMPCGPLQTMQIYALSSGSPVAGALSMLLFSLGTTPLMFGLGALSSALSKRFTHKVMTVGAALIVLLGLSMLSQGWSLSGFAPVPSLPSAVVGGTDAESPSVSVETGVQTVQSTLLPGRYPAIEVQEGIPVKWIIDAPRGSINGCNGRMQIPEYGIAHQFEIGENIIEFTPDSAGTFQYSCWMGMIRSTITVTTQG
jgi:sulfite exporter TauE/SafE